MIKYLKIFARTFLYIVLAMAIFFFLISFLHWAFFIPSLTGVLDAIRIAVVFAFVWTISGFLADVTT